MADTRKPSKPKARPTPPAKGGGKLAKGAAARRAAEQRRRQRAIAYTSLVVLVLAALVTVILVANRSDTPPAPKDPQALAAARAAAGCGDVRQLKAASRNHIAANAQPRDWNSNPPTSGDHLGTQTVPPGVYDAEQDQRALVHSLEHGYVAIQYKNLPDDQVERLREVAEDYQGEKLVVQPYAQLDRDGVALTAWQFLQTCERVDEDVIRAFIADYMVTGSTSKKSTAPEPFAQ